MNIPNAALAVVIAYLLGSIPSAVWIGKGFHNIDVREHGSGNAGTTNTIRVLGWITGIPVLLIDIIFHLKMKQSQCRFTRTLF